MDFWNSFDKFFARGIIILFSTEWQKIFYTFLLDSQYLISPWGARAANRPKF